MERHPTRKAISRCHDLSRPCAPVDGDDVRRGDAGDGDGDDGDRPAASLGSPPPPRQQAALTAASAAAAFSGAATHVDLTDDDNGAAGTTGTGRSGVFGDG